MADLSRGGDSTVKAALMSEADIQEGHADRHFKNPSQSAMADEQTNTERSKNVRIRSCRVLQTDQ